MTETRKCFFECCNYQASMAFKEFSTKILSGHWIGFEISKRTSSGTASVINYCASFDSHFDPIALLQSTSIASSQAGNKYFKRFLAKFAYEHQCVCECVIRNVSVSHRLRTYSDDRADWLCRGTIGLRRNIWPLCGCASVWCDVWDRG